MTTGSSSTLETVTVFGRLFAARAVVIYFALLLLSLGACAYAVTEVLAVTQAADIGLMIRPGRTVDVVDGSLWPGLQRGDEILAIDGRPVASGRECMDVRLKLEPGPHTVTFARAGERTADLRPMTPLSKVAVWNRWADGFLVILVGALVFLLRPGIRMSWLLFLFTQTIGLFLVSILLFQRDTRIYLVLASSFVFTAMSLAVHFYGTYPRDLGILRPRVLALTYAPAVAVSLAVVLVDFGQTTIMPATIAVANAVYFGACIWIVMLQVRRARAEADATSQGKARAFIVAFGLGLAMPLMWDVARRGFGVGLTPWSSYFNTLPVVIYLGITGWTAVTQNAFSIDRFTSALVGYTATLAVLGLAFTALLFGLPLLVGPLFSGSPAVPIAMTLAAAAALRPLYVQLKRRLDRAFFRGAADALTLSELLNKLTHAVQTESKEVALHKALVALMPLGAERAELWSLSSEGGRVHRQRVEGTPSTVQRGEVERKGPLLTALAEQSGGVHGLCELTLPAPAQEELWALELALAVPVRAFGAVAGFLALGRKRSGTAWSKSELAFCEAVATQAGLTLERSREEASQFGHYRIERRLGVGAMAEVFLAWQLGPGGFERRVALKRPLPQLAEDPQSVAMFLDEARLAAQLSHRNIVQVYEVGQIEQTVFMAIEYVDGPPLRAALRRANELQRLPSIEVALAITCGVLNGLEHAHGAKDSGGRPLELVHRDVNPNNVLLTLAGEPKLADFGIARAASRIAATQTGLVKGTLPFMSPEQARGETIDARTDLYAVAAMLYELLSGRRACPEGPLQGGPVRPLELSVPRLAELVMKGLAPDPAARFPHAAAMREALTAVARPGSERDVAQWLQALGPLDASKQGAPPPPHLEPEDTTRTSRRPAT